MPKLKDRLQSLKQALDLKELEKQIQQIETESLDPEFWLQPRAAGQKMQKLADLQETLKEIGKLESKIETLKPEESSPEIEEEIKKLELQTFLSGKYDKKKAIVSLYAGQGGIEAMDWVSVLLRMYLKYLDSKNWKTNVIEETSGEEAGLKSVAVEVYGNYAYGYLKHEQGTHRLVRKSPFNADHLRQTSFARVEVIPLIEENTEIELNPAEVEVQTFRSSGPGGQHANKTESAVRAVHKPTGLTVKVSSSRSQLTNRKSALNLLRGKLYHFMQEQQVEKIQEIKGKYTPPTWGTQIRSYILDPYQMVKDHRTKIEMHQAEDVLNGNLRRLIEAEIQQLK
jgi:peptide chain release factor 2